MSTSTLKAEGINFNDLWPIVLGTVRSVMNMSQYGHTDKPTWQTRFFDIYHLCSASPESYAERLYEETKKFLEEHCISMKKDIDQSDQNTLTIYVKYWNEYKLGAEHLNNLYSCLNKAVVKKQCLSDLRNSSLIDCSLDLEDQPRVEIGQLALDSWTNIIIDSLKDRLVKLLLEQIHLDRLGECVNSTTIKCVIMSFVDVYQNRINNPLELYEKAFEGPFLRATGEFYREEGNQSLMKMDCIQYMKKVLLSIDDEEFRSRKFLNSTSYNKVYNECLQRLVCDHFDTIKIQCNESILREDFNALQNMYLLLKPTHIGITYMVERLQEYIANLGQEKVQTFRGENLPIVFVENLLEFHSKYRQIIREIFTNDSDFISALDKACSVIVNMKYPNRLSMKAPELLAYYCDSLLRKSTKTANENEIEEKLIQATTIFIYLDDKDYFQRFYQKMLARRLINQQSASIDAEEFMVAKLKQICGFEFTSKLTRMFQDIQVSEDLNGKFLEYLKMDSSITNVQNPTVTNYLGLDLNIFVLQNNSWPIAPPMTNVFSIPQVLEKALRLFEEFYSKRYNGRKLTWIYNSSTTEIRMSYADRSYFVTMGTYQMAILVLFNEHDRLTINEIEETTKLTGKELEKQLITLIDNKILFGDLNDLSSESIISINMDFKSKRTKFKITATNAREIHQESDTSHKAVDDDRKFYLQAVIVRVMKARKSLKHNALIEEVITQSKQRFSPSVSVIKKCIEMLIDKQYLQRNSTDEYIYMA